MNICSALYPFKNGGSNKQCTYVLFILVCVSGKGMSREKSLDTDIIVGVCPDMCPEKERYRREETRRLSYFEVLQDGEPRVSRTSCAGWECR